MDSIVAAVSASMVPEIMLLRRMRKRRTGIVVRNERRL